VSYAPRCYQNSIAAEDLLLQKQSLEKEAFVVLREKEFITQSREVTRFGLLCAFAGSRRTRKYAITGAVTECAPHRCDF